ncbi:MAG: ABC transporter permease [Clostridia bacterium]|nr:ABC transporter permease [Clostridia bacterium]
MVKYIIKRLILLVPVIIGVSALVFFIMALAPGDPAITLLGTDAKPEAIEAIHKELGLDDPVIIQYGRYMKNLLRGDLGVSYTSKRPVFEEYMMRFPNTFKLTVFSLLVAVGISIPIGIISAVKQYSLIDNVGMVAALAGLSIPNFWLGLLLILLFALHLGWLPSGGATAPGSVILPAITIGTGLSAAITRLTRSSMLEVVRQDYIRTARAKGVSSRKVITRHALRNALIPIVTIVCMEFGVTLAGAATTEVVFSWPGVGRLTIDAINRKDRPLAIGCLIMTAIMISICNMIMDILYAIVDPRIRLSGSRIRVKKPEGGKA